MTRDEFLARCGNIYDAGLAEPKVLHLLEKWLDGMMRLQGGQMRMFAGFLSAESARTCGFTRTLAGDELGYKTIQFAAILTHPRQICATDSKAWWTRAAFCEHRKATVTPCV